jgi:predicted dienelactone hydrolase
MGGSRAGYSYLGRFWAAHGYAVMHVQHQGSDRQVWAGGPLTILSNLQKAASEDNALSRVRDVRFAIDQIQAGGQSTDDPVLRQQMRRIDTSSLVVAGHSYGANTAMLLSGAQPGLNQEKPSSERQTLIRGLNDPRVRAAIMLSAPPFYGEPDQKGIFASIRIPSLHISGSKDVITVPGYYSPPEDRVSLFKAWPGGQKYLVMFQDATHSIFTDRIDRAGPELNHAVKAATRQMTLDFLDSLPISGQKERLAARESTKDPSGQVLKRADFSVVFEDRIRTAGELIAQAMRE